MLKANKVFKKTELTRKMLRAKAKRALKAHGTWKMRRLGNVRHWWIGTFQ